MKKLNCVISGLVLAGALHAQGAELREVKRVLKDTVTDVAIVLNKDTVFCTERGYGTVQLKISVPDLDWLAHFDHRVVGETLPCITGGQCSDRLNPGTIVGSDDPIEVAPVRVTLSEHLTINDQAKSCKSLLDERIQASIRGRVFTHYKVGDLKEVDYEKCVRVVF